MKELLIFLVFLFMSNVFASVSFFEGNFEEEYFIDLGTTGAESVNNIGEKNISIDFVSEDKKLLKISLLEERDNERNFSIFEYRNGGVYLKTEWKFVSILLSIFLIFYIFLKLYGGKRK